MLVCLWSLASFVLSMISWVVYLTLSILIWSAYCYFCYANDYGICIIDCLPRSLSAKISFFLWFLVFLCVICYRWVVWRDFNCCSSWAILLFDSLICCLRDRVSCAWWSYLDFISQVIAFSCYFSCCCNTCLCFVDLSRFCCKLAISSSILGAISFIRPALWLTSLMLGSKSWIIPICFSISA